MRHLWSLLAGIVAAPLTWLLIAIGQLGSRETVAAWDATDAFDSADLVRPAACLAAAGVLLGLIAALRFSPLGPVAAGLLLAAPTGGLFLDPFRTRDLVDERWTLLGQDLAPRLPAENGTLLVLGALLLMAVFSRQRWRVWPGNAAPPVAAAAAPDPAGVPRAAELAPDAGPVAPEPDPGAEPEPDAGGTDAAGITLPAPRRATPSELGASAAGGRPEPS